MSIERDQDFEQLEDIAAMMAENPGIEFENGKYVYYGLDGRTAFAAVYISGAWSAWQAAKSSASANLKQVIDNLNNIKASEFRQHHYDYDKGWRDCAVTVLNDLKAQEQK